MEQQKKRDCWEGIIREWPESGLSQREYCLRQSLSYSTFRYWYRSLGSGNAKAEASRRVRAIEVSKKAMKPQSAAMNPVASGEVETDKIVIEILGTEATVTISGRMSLTCLSRIMSAFKEIVGHAEA
ncbi:MAG: IS66 family insertion sequence element accessory protein TnpA [Rectinemataceae bacterium]